MQLQVLIGSGPFVTCLLSDSDSSLSHIPHVHQGCYDGNVQKVTKGEKKNTGEELYSLRHLL